MKMKLKNLTFPMISFYLILFVVRASTTEGCNADHDVDPDVDLKGHDRVKRDYGYGDNIHEFGGHFGFPLDPLHGPPTPVIKSHGHDPDPGHVKVTTTRHKNAPRYIDCFMTWTTIR